ncbi:MAG: EI24 domain-containing protein [Desulfobulbales bacterium]
MTLNLKNNPVSNFSQGFLYPFRAGKFIKGHPVLFKYIIVPFLINFVILSVAVFWGLSFFNSVVVHYIPQGDAWYWVILSYFLWTVAILMTMVLVFFGFTVTGAIISSPFNDILSEKTEELLTGIHNEEPFVFKVFLRDAMHTVMDESKKIIIFVALMAFLLPLNLCPGGSLPYSILSVLLTIFFLVVEYTGYVFYRKHLTFRDQRNFIYSQKFLMLGFGTGVMGVLAVPFLQFFCIPLGVVGATQLWHDLSGLKKIKQDE